MDALTAVPASFARLLAGVEGLDEAAVRAASRLPGWTRGHLLTHLARSADAMGRVLGWAVTGVETPLYASAAAREADIEAGAGRAPEALLRDLVAAHQRLLDAMGDMDDEARHAPVRIGPQPIQGGDLAFLRLRELELHHVDLAVGYGPLDWSHEFAVTTLDAIAARADEHESTVSQLQDPGSGRHWRVAAAGPVLRGVPQSLLAWATGRRTDEPLDSEPAGEIPAAPGWP